ncbi:pyroglutamyl-peptidase I [Oerskovia flava]|uniref:pyroglutamyl-peptidase I n=1 Tax=Oerskovia flava TaxID=2986422 RepID=UPI0022406CD4|nr:pyroglutamyl-peptidase I [Oerskovia sp. JB1-3-2]
MILLSGFEPFGGEETNPSWLAVQRLAGERVAPRGVGGDPREEVVAVRLPCTFAGAWAELARAIEEHRPRAVVAVGLAAGTTHVRLERVAVNVVDARIPDNDGAAPVDVPVVPGGPAAYFSGLPLKSTLAALREDELPAVVSNTAGTYVCNATFYALMDHVARHEPHLVAGFVHVPRATSEPGEGMSLDQIVGALRTVAAAALVDGPEPALSGGTEA